VRDGAECVAGCVCSATHYVGYVEDEESVEMIMKKFEVLERMKVRSLSKPRA
jgi:hypothetical protein